MKRGYSVCCKMKPYWKKRPWRLLFFYRNRIAVIPDLTRRRNSPPVSRTICININISIHIKVLTGTVLRLVSGMYNLLMYWQYDNGTRCDYRRNIITQRIGINTAGRRLHSIHRRNIYIDIIILFVVFCCLQRLWRLYTVCVWWNNTAVQCNSGASCRCVAVDTLQAVDNLLCYGLWISWCSCG